MANTAIITDTDSSIPLDLSQRMGIHQVPINVHFKEEVFQAGVDLSDQQLFARVDQDGALPTTSAPSPGQFVTAFQKAIAEGADELICFTVSGEISGTYNSALSARDLLPEADITVVDTQHLSIGQGFMVLEAARYAQQGASREEIIQRARQVGERVHLYAALSTLKYLAMSGRVGHLAAGMANVLNIKPILTVQDGKLDLLEKIRTRKKAWARVLNLIGEAMGGKTPEQMAILHVNALDQVEEFQPLVRETLPCPEEILIAELTPGLSVHSGAGMIGVCVVASA